MATNAQLQQQINALAARITACENRLTACEGRLAALETRQAADEARIAKLETQVAQLFALITVNPPTPTPPRLILTCGGPLTAASPDGNPVAVTFPSNQAVPSGGTTPYGTVVYSPTSGSSFAVGTTTVTATCTDAANQTATCQFTVTITHATVTLTAITVSGSAPPIGGNSQFHALGTYSDTHQADVTSQATWASNNTPVATVGATTGLVHGVAAGTATISATIGTISNSLPCTIVPVGATVLRPSDFTYLGCFALPQDISDAQSTGTSYGTITLRRLNGVLQLITTGRDVGNVANGWIPDQVYEVIVPTTLYPDVNSAMAGTRAAYYAWWGDVWQGKRIGASLPILGQPPGTPTNPNTNASLLAGLLWDPVNNGIWSAWEDSYGITVNDPCLVLTIFNDATKTCTAYGPWRPTCGSKFGGGYMTMLPTAFSGRGDLAGTPIANKRLVLGSAFGSGGGSSPWGITSFVVTTEPTPATPPDPITPQTASVPGFTLAAFDINHLQPAPSGLLRQVCQSMLYQPPGFICDPTLPFDLVEPVLGPVGVTAGVGGNVFNDYTTSVAWINTPGGKQGVIYAQQMVDGVTQNAHAWYGNNECVHCQLDPWHQDTGPGANTRKMGFFIYDQNDFAKVALNTLDKFALRETSFTYWVSLTAQIDLSTIAIGSLRFAYDPVDNRLYVSESGRDGSNPYAFKAIIHVFQVAN